MPFPKINLSHVHTYRLSERCSFVALQAMLPPQDPPPVFENPELAQVAQSIVTARQAGAPVIWMIGGHVVKRGLSLLLIELIRRRVITHLASNGAAAIHDFEIAMQGATSEDVASSIEDGSFGMAEETGFLMNQAIRLGAQDGLGLGEALGRWIVQDNRFRYRDHSLLYQAYAAGLPYTVHLALGTDIIHQHPHCDFAAQGWASGEDFKIFTASVSRLEAGVFCNFGSAVIGPEVFLKALSISRNIGSGPRAFTTANFDLLPLQDDYRQPSGDDDPEYYYRPKKNIVIRPNSLGGRGYHIAGDHRLTIPNLFHQVVELLGDQPFPPLQLEPAASPLPDALQQRPDLQPVAAELLQAIRSLALCFSTGGTLFIAAGDDSASAARRLAERLSASFKNTGNIPAAHRQRFTSLPGGAELAARLRTGLRVVVLGSNPPLAGLVADQSPGPGLALAQEFYVLARPGDLLLAISATGQAEDVCNTALAAKALGISVIALAGASAGRLAELAEVTISPPDLETTAWPGWLQLVSRALSEMLPGGSFRPENT